MKFGIVVQNYESKKLKFWKIKVQG